MATTSTVAEAEPLAWDPLEREVQGRPTRHLEAPPGRGAALLQRGARLLRRQPLRRRRRLQPGPQDVLLLARHGARDDHGRQVRPRDHDLHGPARAHPLPAPRLEGIHPSTDGGARGGHPHAGCPVARRAGREILLRLRAGLRRQGARVRHRRAAGRAARGPRHVPRPDRRDVPPRPRAGHVQRDLARVHGPAAGVRRPACWPSASRSRATTCSPTC